MGNKRTIFEAARNIVRRENFIITTKQFEDFKKQRQMEENQTKTTDHERHHWKSQKAIRTAITRIQGGE